MMKLLNIRSRIFAMLLLGLCTPALATAQTISGADLGKDLRDWRRWLLETHPDPSHTMDLGAVDAAFEATATLEKTFTPRSAWLAMASLNPVFSDAHVGLRLPDKAYAAALEQGAAPFDVAVTVSGGKIFLADETASEILSINGVAAAEITGTMLPRMRGESPRLRERVLSLRFPVALWTLLGDQPSYTIELRAADGSVHHHPLPLTSPTASAAHGIFDLAFVGGTAVLTVESFAHTLEAEFETFLEGAFKEIANADVGRLLIDLRSNGGGARDLSDRLMSYLTTDRYTPISAVSARITPDNQALIPDSRIGQVIHTPFAQWVHPPPELENRFTGEIAILIGPATYSQAIAFSVTAQDFRIATLIGSQTEGRANQTGQVQRHTLPVTGFEVQAPLYVFTRPSGNTDDGPLTPDITLPGSGEIQLHAAITTTWNAENQE